jgi:hypothetical protein
MGCRKKKKMLEVEGGSSGLHSGELSLEEAMGMSQDRLRLDLNGLYTRVLWKHCFPIKMQPQYFCHFSISKKYFKLQNINQSNIYYI